MSKLSEAQERISKVIQAQPYHIEVTRGQRGNYGWTISVHSENLEKAFQEICILDARCRMKFAPLPNKATDVYVSDHEADVASHMG